MCIILLIYKIICSFEKKIENIYQKGWFCYPRDDIMYYIDVLSVRYLFKRRYSSYSIF